MIKNIEQENSYIIPKSMKAWVLGSPHEIKMIEKDVPIDCIDHSGETPVHHAARTGNFDIVSLFEKAGADKQHTNFQGDTARSLLYEDARYSLI